MRGLHIFLKKAKRVGTVLLCVLILVNTIQIDALAAEDTQTSPAEGMEEIQDGAGVAAGIVKNTPGGGAEDDWGGQADTSAESGEESIEGAEAQESLSGATVEGTPEEIGESMPEETGEGTPEESGEGSQESEGAEMQESTPEETGEGTPEESGEGSQESEGAETQESTPEETGESTPEESGEGSQESEGAETQESTPEETDESTSEETGEGSQESEGAETQEGTPEESGEGGQESEGTEEQEETQESTSGENGEGTSEEAEEGSQESEGTEEQEKTQESTPEETGEGSPEGEGTEEQEETQEGVSEELDGETASLNSMGVYEGSPLDETQTLNVKVAGPDGLTNGGTLELKREAMDFFIEFIITGTTVDEPVLEIVLPSCMTVSNYPKADDKNLQGKLADGNAVDLRGGTLTYRFKPKTAEIGFSISAQISSGYEVKDGVYTITVNYKNGGATTIKSEEYTFTASNPTVTPGNVWVDQAWAQTGNDAIYLKPGQKEYYTNEYIRTIKATSSHYPYDSVTMTVLIPKEAVPCVKSGDSYTPLTGSRTIGSDRWTHEVSYDGNDIIHAGVTYHALIYKLARGNILSSGGSSYEAGGDRYRDICLKFDNPTAGTYTAPSPKIECQIDGETVTMCDFGSTGYTTSVEFKEYPAVTVNPGGKWEDVINLQHGQTIYDTKEFYRSISLSTGIHYPFDTVKMTVPLPEGAVPGFGAGDYFTAMGDGAPKTVTNGGNKWQVTYNQSQNTLEYEILSGDFLKGGSTRFIFSGNEKMYLRYTEPEPVDKVYTAASPTISCEAEGKVIAQFNGTPNNYPTTVTIIRPPDGNGLISDFKQNGNQWWSDVITMDEGETIYYTKPYIRKIYSPDKHYYPYESVTMTVLLPDEAVPGFGTGNDFSAFRDGQTYKPSYYSDSDWDVTYHAAYPYGTGGETAKALIYRILPGAPFLKSGNSFSFTSESKDIHLRFSGQKAAAVYTSAASPEVRWTINGTEHVSGDAFAETSFDTSVEFKERPVAWSGLSVSSKTNRTTYYLDETYVLPEEHQSDKVYEGYLTNQTGFGLQNVQVEYTFDTALSADKLSFFLGDKGYPSSAEVKYTTMLDTEEKTVNLDAANKVVLTSEGDAFSRVVVTYDSLEKADTAKKVMTASIHNYERAQDSTSKSIKAAILSAECARDNGEGAKSFGSPDTRNFLRKYRLDMLEASVSTSPQSLEKGDAFTVTVQTGGGGYSDGRYQNLCLYLRLPKGYRYESFEPPIGAQRGYEEGSRTLSNGETLCWVRYTDDVMYWGKDYKFHCYVGPDADTFERKNISLPVAVYAAAGEGKLFQFGNMKKESESEIGFDINGDGDSEDSFYLPAVPTVEIRLFTAVSIEGYLAVQGRPGESINNKYSATSSGNYRFYLYNGTSVESAVTDGKIKLSLARRGQEFKYKNKQGEDVTYVAQWDVRLTKAIETHGTFLEGATVSYSVDGSEDGNWLTEGEVVDFRDIRYIMVETASGSSLNKAESAYLDIPFAVDFPEGGTADEVEEFKSYVSAYMSYQLVPHTTETLYANLLNELTAIPEEFSGTVYHDTDGNEKQDSEERTGNSYTLRLYRGDGTEGEPIQEIKTAEDGSYTFEVLLQGKYTLHVEKNEAGELYEYLTDGCPFDSNGNYTFELSPGKAIAKTNINLGLVTPRILTINEDSVLLTGKKSGWVNYTLTPNMFDWEKEKGKKVSFESSEDSAVTVDEWGNIRLVSNTDNPVKVKVTAPQLEAVVRLWKEEAGAAWDGALEWLTGEVEVLTPESLELPPPIFTISPEKPDGDDGIWYKTEPDVTLTSGTTLSDVGTWFEKKGEEEWEERWGPLTFYNKPAIDGSGIYSFRAYNSLVLDYGEPPVYSVESVLEDIRVDVDPPRILEDEIEFSAAGVGLLSDIGRFLTAGNFFKEAVRVSVKAEDLQSGMGTLYYCLPGEEEQSKQMESDGTGYFDIPMDTHGKVVFYVKDRAGNKSDQVVLRKDEGPDLWVVEDDAPQWSEFTLTGIDGEEGVRGADGAIWFAGAFEASAEVTDADSGLAVVSASVNEGELEEVWVCDLLKPPAPETDEEVLEKEEGDEPEEDEKDVQEPEEASGQTMFAMYSARAAEGEDEAAGADPSAGEGEAAGADPSTGEDEATDTDPTAGEGEAEDTDPAADDGRQYSYVLKRTIETEGKSILRARAEDNARNISDTEMQAGIDKTAPEIVLEDKSLVGNEALATVLVTDGESGVNPGSIRIDWQGKEIAGTVSAADGGYRVSFPIQTVPYEDGGTSYLMTVEDYVGWPAELTVTCYVQAPVAASEEPAAASEEPVASSAEEPVVNRGRLDRVPKTGERQADRTTARADRAEFIMTTRKKDEQDGEEDRLRQA